MRVSSLIHKAAAREWPENADEMASSAANVQNALVSPLVVIINEGDSYEGAEVMKETVQQAPGWPSRVVEADRDALPPYCQACSQLATLLSSKPRRQHGNVKVFSRWPGLVVTAKHNRITWVIASVITLLYESLTLKLCVVVCW